MYNLKDKIEECVKHVLKEYLQQIADEYNDDVFDWDVFNNLKTYHDRKEYCVKHLGQPIGSGLSRDVFEVDDHTVLKLGNINSRSNRNEYAIFKKEENNILIPKVYGKSEDYSWIWVERVIPTNENNIDDVFVKVLGVPYFPSKESGDKFTGMYPSVYGFINWYDYTYNGYERAMRPNDKTEKIYQTWAKNHKWFKDLINLMEYGNPLEFHANNFGLVLRNGKPQIVVTDMGL